MMDMFEYAGANLGGQMVFTCADCGLLVTEDKQSIHLTWHEALGFKKVLDGIASDTDSQQ